MIRFGPDGCPIPSPRSSSPSLLAGGVRSRFAVHRAPSSFPFAHAVETDSGVYTVCGHAVDTEWLVMTGEYHTAIEFARLSSGQRLRFCRDCFPGERRRFLGPVRDLPTWWLPS